jgi:hypothetical protein
MTRHARLPRPPRRAFVALAVTSSLATTACPDATWTVKQELAPIRLPRKIVITVWKSPRVRALDEEGLTDALVLAVAEGLAERHTLSTVTDLADAPTLPRIELVFWTAPSETVGTGRVGQRAMTVDCAFVSATDEVHFVGRVRGYGKDGDASKGAHEAAKAIVYALAGR